MEFEKLEELKEWLNKGMVSCKNIISNQRKSGGQLGDLIEDDKEIARLTEKINTLNMVIQKIKELERSC